MCSGSQQISDEDEERMKRTKLGMASQEQIDTKFQDV